MGFRESTSGVWSPSGARGAESAALWVKVRRIWAKWEGAALPTKAAGPVSRLWQLRKEWGWDWQTADTIRRPDGRLIDLPPEAHVVNAEVRPFE